MLALAKRHAVALLALVLALSGAGAYAAGKIGGKRIKRRAIHSRHIASGAIHLRHLGPDVYGRFGSGGGGGQGPQGPQGARGPQGPRGNRGPTGPKGERGPTGTAGTALPAGKALRGTWAVTGPTGAEGAVSYNLLLTFKPAGHVLPAGSAPTNACPGSASTPDAAGGNLCVYTAPGSTAAVDLFAPAPGSENYGFGVRTSADGRASGTWAVRAP